MNIIFFSLVTILLALFANDLMQLNIQQKCGIALLIMCVVSFFSSIQYRTAIKEFIETNPTTSYWIFLLLILIPCFSVGVLFITKKQEPKTSTAS